MKYTLFTKPDCKKCDYIKERFDLKELGVRVVSLVPMDVDKKVDMDAVEALALLTWYELNSIAETKLPILLITDEYDNLEEVITGAISIKNKLKEGK